jgi:voltage-gated potassium channel
LIEVDKQMSQDATSAQTNTASSETVPHHHAPYLLFILLVSIFAIVILAADMFVDPASDTARILRFCDTVLCGLFFLDFLLYFAHAKNKTKYMLTWGWLDLVSSIPAVGALRWGRAARLARVLRVLRGIRSARILMRFILERRAQRAGLAAAHMSIVVVAVSSIAILYFEGAAGSEANIRSVDDALWWSFVTIMTVGYGDRYPVTMEGRCVAIGLMAVGVALIGTWAGIATSWFLAAADEKHHDNIHTLRLELQELRQIVMERLKG